MSSSIYFPTKEQYNEWMADNYTNYIISLANLGDGVYIEYIKGKKDERKKSKTFKKRG